MTPEQIANLDLDALTPDQREAIEELVRLDRETVLWRPLPGPQQAAFESEADILGYGGAAGGGKSALAVGLAATRHERIAIFRENGTELAPIIDYLHEVVGDRGSFNARDSVMRFSRPDGARAQVEFGSFPNHGDERKYQGRPHDLLVFDEAANMRKQAVTFLLGWMRTTTPGQRCRAILCFNPPTSVEGKWVIDYFGPWLDRKHPRPALSGELRWFFTGEDGKEREVDGPGPYQVGKQMIRAQSRTFIPSRITDNPYLLGTGYLAQLNAMPEPLRSQLLYGDFQAGVADDPWQVIPTGWVEASMARWVACQGRAKPMDSVGVDIARGGRDQTVIARRHGSWFDVPLVYPGSGTPDGPTVAGLVTAATRDDARIHVDVIGVGSSPFDFLREHMGPRRVKGVNVSARATALDRSRRLTFKNLRSQQWWQMREALDPLVAEKSGIALPPDRRLLADLTSATWKLSGSAIQVSSRDEILSRIGRSPDFAAAYLLAAMGGTARPLKPADRLGITRQRDPKGERGPLGFGDGLPDPFASLFRGPQDQG